MSHERARDESRAEIIARLEADNAAKKAAKEAAEKAAEKAASEKLDEIAATRGRNSETRACIEALYKRLSSYNKTRVFYKGIKNSLTDDKKTEEITAIQKLKQDLERNDLDRSCNVEPPFIYFAKRKRPDIIKLFFEAGVAVDTRDAKGRTGLQLAVRENLHDAARLLLEAGADVNALDHKDRPPIFFAFSKGSGDFTDRKQFVKNCEQDAKEMVSLLASYGAEYEIDRRDSPSHPDTAIGVKLTVKGKDGKPEITHDIDFRFPPRAEEIRAERYLINIPYWEERPYNLYQLLRLERQKYKDAHAEQYPPAENPHHSKGDATPPSGELSPRPEQFSTPCAGMPPLKPSAPEEEKEGAASPRPRETAHSGEMEPPRLEEAGGAGPAAVSQLVRAEAARLNEMGQRLRQEAEHEPGAQPSPQLQSSGVEQHTALLRFAQMQERAKNLSSAGVEVPPKTPQEQVGFFERLQQLRQNHQKKDEPATPPGEIGFF